jgi:hypothetical protein
MSSTLPSPIPAQPGFEQRRKYPRFPCGPATFCIVVAGPFVKPDLAAVRDISRGGIGLILARRIQPGKVVTLNLFNVTRNFACQVVMRVIYTNKQADGSYFVGGAFGEELIDEEVQWLV